MADLALQWNSTVLAADLSVAANDIATDAGLQTAVLLSLFLDRRADDGDVLPDGTDDRRGWWGDGFAAVEGDRIGSRLWMLARAKASTETARRAEEYAREALAWLTEDRVASKVETSAEIQTLGSGTKAMTLAVAVHRPGKADPTRYRFDGVWRAME